jgi:hypothetical protein
MNSVANNIYYGLKRISKQKSKFDGGREIEFTSRVDVIAYHHFIGQPCDVKRKLSSFIMFAVICLCDANVNYMH